LILMKAIADVEARAVRKDIHGYTACTRLKNIWV
jgi:hypothetical protein